MLYYIYDYYASNGGIVNGAIFLVAVLTLYTGLRKLLQYHAYRSIKKGYSDTPGVIKTMASVDIWFSAHEGSSVLNYRNIFRERLIEVSSQLDEGLNTMAALIQAAPLLGLFGTVMGMIRTFTLITSFGTANPVVLTEGITISLLTTQAGLLVAFPSMLFHNYVVGRKNALVQEIIAHSEAVISGMSTEKSKDEL
ncbi:MotA/TolQ/ExbB proton channel family protein [Chitinispirillum alkaliphilum]|nr:MotA/TolQ/ExbB proton channel family protein [Chitinispirillum alkaliphilum]